jgi:hypothetical protein
MKGRYVNDSLKRVWKEEFVAEFEGAIPEFAWRDWGKSRKTSVMGEYAPLKRWSTLTRQQIVKPRELSS